MSTNTFNSIHHHYYRSLRRRHSIDCPPTAGTTFFLRPTTAAAALSHSTSFSAATTAAASAATSTTNPSTSQNATLDLLQHHLSTGNLRQADEETRRLIIALAGDAAVKRGYVFFSEVQFIPADELRAIDALWRQHSEGRFGYSVQRKIWKKSKSDFTTFFIKVGWMKKLDTEVEQYNYRSFPAEFVWEMAESPPEGHLPLTNALRGTQLLSCILTHPAFDGDDEEEERDGGEERESGAKPLSNSKRSTAAFKTNYSF